MLYTLLIVFYVLVSASLIGLILFQQGKGADAGAAFGSGSSGTVFGARGAGNFLTRSTAWLATVFFILSLALAYVVHGRSGGNSVVDTSPEASAPKAPAADTPVMPDSAPAAAAATPQAPVANSATPAAPATTMPAPAAAAVKPDAAAASKPAAPAPKAP